MYEKYLEQLEEAGKIRNLKGRSINCYKNYVSYFLKYQGKSPEELTCQDVRTFLLAKKDEGLKATTLNLYNSAIRFFYRNVLHILWDDIKVPRMILEHKLPTVLTAPEIDRLLEVVDDIKYKAMFATMYSSGMRVSEVIHLHYDDISRSNMQIHVRDTKNRMDRYTILSKRCLNLLTQYWFEKGRPRGILFPNKFTGNYLTVSTLEQVMRRAVSVAELPKEATPHCLRHSFATHLIAAVPDILFRRCLPANLPFHPVITKPVIGRRCNAAVNAFSGMSFNAARQSLFIMTLLLTDAPVSMFTTFPPKKHRTPEPVRLIIYFLNVQSAPPPVLE